MKEWLKDLEPGDKVYIDSGKFGSTDLNLTTIKKITPKGHVRTEYGTLFRDGSHNVDSWHSDSLIQWTQELEDKLKAEAHFNHMAREIKDTNLRALSSEKLQKIYDIIKGE